MFLGYGFGVIAAIFVGSMAAMVHASGHAPLGLVSFGVGASLGAILSGIAVWRHMVRDRRFIFATIALALLTIFLEHDCLYLDFCRQWRESREKSPQVAMFRSEAPISPVEYFSHEWTPQRGAFWLFDAIVITASAVGTVLVLRRKQPPTLSSEPPVPTP